MLTCKHDFSGICFYNGLNGLPNSVFSPEHVSISYSIENKTSVCCELELFCLDSALVSEIVLTKIIQNTLTARNPVGHSLIFLIKSMGFAVLNPPKILYGYKSDELISCSKSLQLVLIMLLLPFVHRSITSFVGNQTQIRRYDSYLFY